MENEIWKWFENDYKVHCKNREDYDKILSWKKSRPGGVYSIRGEPSEYDAIIPEEYVERAAKLLGLTPKSSGKSRIECQRVTGDKIAAERRSLAGINQGIEEVK